MKSDIDLDAILKQMAAEHQPQLPSPGVIWFRAQILRKARQKERIERPMQIMRVLAAFTVASILLKSLGDNWSQMQDVIKHGSGLLLPSLLLTLAAFLVSGAMLLWSPAKR